MPMPQPSSSSRESKPVADGVWVTKRTLTLPYGTLATLHSGVSEVHLRSNVLTGEQRACKQVSLLGREDTVAYNEALLLKGIDHPNVVKVFDVAEVAGSDPALQLLEILMPYYTSGSVMDAMVRRGERFSVGAARDVAVKALRGFACLHDEHRILHRDPKPANLFLAGDETVVKVGDFGEAVMMDDAGTADPLLSPQFWTPPESFRGGRYTVASEIFGMGMSLFELLSGPLPYDDYAREDLGRRLARGWRPVKDDHLRFAPQVPEALRLVVRKAIQIKPQRRYRSAEEMLRALLAARFVDWRWSEGSGDKITWQGECRGRSYRVVARALRGGRWRARPEQLYPSGWRGLYGALAGEDVDPVEAARAAFSQIERHLAND